MNLIGRFFLIGSQGKLGGDGGRGGRGGSQMLFAEMTWPSEGQMSVCVND